MNSHGITHNMTKHDTALTLNYSACLNYVSFLLEIVKQLITFWGKKQKIYITSAKVTKNIIYITVL